MRRSHEPLIKLAKFKVEELQKQMSALAAARADLDRQVADLAASVPEEQVAANASREGYLAYGSYAQAVIQRKENLRASIADVEERAGQLRSELSEALRELKKYELMESRRQAQIAEARPKLSRMSSTRSRPK